MSWFWTIIFLCFTFNITFSDAKHQKLRSAAVVGTVYCHTCFLKDSPSTPQFHSIPGASVAVECKGTASRPGFQQEVKTNSHGEFTLHLPVLVSRHDKKINGCSVKIIRSNHAACAIPATASTSALHLKSRQHKKHIFSAGFFTFKPLKQPQLCDQKQSLSDPEFLPQLPPLPGIPFFPPAHTRGGTPEASKTEDRTLDQPTDFFLPPNPLNPPLIPPNPLQPPPSIFPPFFPSPPPSIFPPIFPSPPPPTFPPFLPTPPINLPPIPGLIPSPSPPLPVAPSFPIPLPPFPFQPTPGFPGVPPARPKSSNP